MATASSQDPICSIVEDGTLKLETKDAINEGTLQMAAARQESSTNMALKDQGTSSETFTCDLCGPGTMACRRCLDCEENYCKPCCHSHEKSKATKQHKISELGTLNPELKGKIRQRIYCEKHSDEEIKFVCRKCNVLTCAMCNVLEHDTHTSTTATTAAAERQKKLEEKLPLCSDKLKRLRGTRTEGEKLMKEISDTKSGELKAFDEHYANLKKSLKHEAEKLKEKIQRIYDELINEGTVFKESVDNEIKACCDANEKANTLINHGTDIEKFKQVPDLEQIFDKVTSESDPKIMPCLQKKLFSSAAIKTSELSSLIGTVQDCTRLSPDFQVLIHEEAVHTKDRMYRRDVLVLNDEVDLMRNNIYAALRRFILGSGQRHLIPSCCV